MKARRTGVREAKTRLNKLGGPAEGRLVDLIRGYRLSQAVYVMTRLGIPDLLANAPREIDELAHATASHAPTLYRVLRALAGAGLFEEVGPRRFALTAVGAGLRADVPGSLRTAVMMWFDESNWQAWGHLLHTVRTGETAFRHVHGADYFGYLAQHPEAARIFDAAMTGLTAAQAPAIATAYNLSNMSRVVDVGGGHGKLLAVILQRYPAIRGVLLDLPHVVEGARRMLEAEGVANRCELVGGNFFESVPDGGDVYILRHIIHDWEDDQAVTILTNCRRAMSKGARLVLVERYFPPEHREALPVLLVDLEMLVNVGGRERTTEEYAALLTRSSLRLARTIPLGQEFGGRDHKVEHHLIEATPV